MFVRNMSLVRKYNPCLSLYKVVCTNPSTNEYSYLSKTDGAESESIEASLLADKSVEKLEVMMSMKKYY